MPTSDETKMLQMLATQMHALLAITVAREKFGTVYYDLKDAERDQVEGLVASMIRHYWKLLRP